MALSNALSDLYRKYPLATICVGLSVLVLGAYAYRFTELDDREQARETLQGEVDGLRRNVRNAANLKANLDQLKDGVTKLESRLVKESDQNNTQAHFFRLEQAAGMKLTFNQGAEDSKVRAGRKSAYVLVPFSVTGAGTYAQVLSTLRALETGSLEYHPVTLRLLPATGGEKQADQVFLDLYLELLGTP